MASLGSLVIELSANSARLSSDLGKAVGVAERAAAGMQKAFRFAGGGLLGIAAANAARQAFEMGDQLAKAAVKASVAGEVISELAFAAKLADVDLAGLSNGLRFMQVNLSRAGTGAKETEDALRALGLTAADLKNLAPEKQFELLADRISKLKDPADRARAAVEIFGRAGSDLLPLFAQGAEGIRKAREEAQRLGQSFSTEQLQKIEAANDAVTKLKGSWGSFWVILAAKVAPTLQKVLDLLSGVEDRQSFFESILVGLAPASGSVDGFVSVVEAERKKLEAAAESLAALEQQRAVGAGGPLTRGRALGPIGYVPDPKKEAAKVKEIEQSLFEYRESVRGISLEIVEIFDDDLESVRGDFVATFGDIEDTISGTLDEVGVKAGAKFDEMSTFADQAARNMQDVFADFLFDPFSNGLKGMLKGFIDVIRRMIAEAAAAKIFEALGFGKGGGKDGGILGTIIGALIPGKAVGGPVTGGSPYIVGERGPELFVPGRSGSIVPNNKLGGGGQVVYAPVYNFSGTARELAEFRQYVDARDEAYSRNLVNELDRRYGIA